MDPRVRNLYKRILLVGRDYPLGLEWVKGKAKPWFAQNAGLRDEVEVNRAISQGRYMVREMIGVVQLKKYRTIKQRYYDAADDERRAALLEAAADRAAGSKQGDG